MPSPKRMFVLHAGRYPMRVLTSGLSDAPEAFRQASRKNLVSPVVRAFILFFVFKEGGVGAIATHIDDILRCGEPDLLLDGVVRRNHSGNDSGN